MKMDEKLDSNYSNYKKRSSGSIYNKQTRAAVQKAVNCAEAGISMDLSMHDDRMQNLQHLLFILCLTMYLSYVQRWVSMYKT